MEKVLSLFDLKGRCALVTGAGQGLGKGLALALGAAGADVVTNDIRGDNAEETAAQIRALGRRSSSVVADVARKSDVDSMASQARDFGAIDIPVNNAGISRHAASETMPLGDWQTVINVNLTGLFLCCQAFVPEMKRRS